eukprot:3383556-Amphidinium_carterae.1
MAECIHAGIAYFFDMEVEMGHHCETSWASYCCRAPCCTWVDFPDKYVDFFKTLFKRPELQVQTA